MLDICLLGTGGVVPLPDRWLSSLLIRYNGRMLLIDCGEGTQIPLTMTKWGLKSIDAILFTHYHADHIAGLLGLLLTIGNAGRVEPLILIGPAGLLEVIKGLTVITPILPYEIELIDLSKDEVYPFNNLVIKWLPVDHNMPCLSYSIEVKRKGEFDVKSANILNIPKNYWKTLQNGEKVKVGDRMIAPENVMGKPRKGIKVCYCTDTRPTEALKDFIRDADLFICEGMYGDNENFNTAFLKKHMLFSEAAKLSKQGDVKELWLTHYSPSLTEPNEYIDNAKCIFSNTVIGKDLLTKTLTFN